MSMGPNIGETDEKTTLAIMSERVGGVIRGYKDDPVGGTFYLTLLITIFGLFFGMTFSIMYYVVLCGLLLAKIYRYFYGRNIKE